jgi:uncharacterized protein DUF5916
MTKRLIAAVCLLWAGLGLAQTKPAATPTSTREVKIPRLAQAPTLADFEGMQPHGVATQMLVLSDFIQQVPSDGAQPSQKTQTYLGYDDKNVYIAWICFDTKRASLRAHLDRRENLFDDDYVEVLLDTFHDKRHAFVFDVNPLGVQADGLWTDGNGADYSWDSVWDSTGKATPEGYIVLEAIPFKTLRFRHDAEQTWGIVLVRYCPREGEVDFWPRVSSTISSTLQQQASIRGFEHIPTVRNMQFNPYTNLRTFRALDTRDPLDPHFDQKMLQARIGLDSKFVFHNSLVLDLTVNPDFSQVESDEPQNVINQRFEIFFPEKRPFFLENANYFQTGQDGNFGLSRLLFTRRIADPTAGLRFTGKLGNFDIGIFSTDDRSPGLIVPDTDPLAGKRAYFNIARIAYNFGHQSSVSAIFTDREFNGDFNRVGAFDLKLRLGNNWMFYGRSAVSSTLDRTFGSGYLYGSNTELALNGQGRRFHEWLMYQDISPGFRTEVGFVPRVDMRHLYDYAHFYWRPEGKRLVFWGPEGSGERIWDHSGKGVMYNVNGDIVFALKRNTIIAPVIGIESDTLRPQDFSGLTSDRKFIQQQYGIVFNSAPWRQLTFSIRAFRQGAVTLVVPAGELPVEGDETTATVTVGLKPFDRLQVDNTWLFDRVKHNPVDHAVFDSNIIRSKWNYQFTRALSFRFIAQYNGLLANPQFSSLPTVKSVNYDFLLTYLVHPGTAVYVGYNTNLQNLAPELCLRIAGTNQCDPTGPGLLRTRDTMINDGRQFFVKISYLWRP